MPHSIRIKLHLFLQNLGKYFIKLISLFKLFGLFLRTYLIQKKKIIINKIKLIAFRIKKQMYSESSLDQLEILTTKLQLVLYLTNHLSKSSL